MSDRPRGVFGLANPVGTVNGIIPGIMFLFTDSPSRAARESATWTGFWEGVHRWRLNRKQGKTTLLCKTSNKGEKNNNDRVSHVSVTVAQPTNHPLNKGGVSRRTVCGGWNWPLIKWPFTNGRRHWQHIKHETGWCNNKLDPGMARIGQNGIINFAFF